MNAPERIDLPDIQSRSDVRGVPITAVGVKGLRQPVTIATRHGLVPTVATLATTVGLPAEAKGTHMSRFVELLERHAHGLTQSRFRALTLAMLERLDAASGTIEMRFPWFVRKAAPVSGVTSLLDHDVCWRGQVDAGGTYAFTLGVAVPATSLCPCSKEISEYGAHNQRSVIAIEAELAAEMSVEELIAIAERSASCEVYGILKRVDEKHVTERAYDNPRFVEDLVREVALALHADPRVAAYCVDAENFESIHNHSAFARVESPAWRARAGGGAPRAVAGR